MLSIEQIKIEVDRLAAIIGAAGQCELPTYGKTEDFARPHIEVNARGYHFVVVERGQELERFTTPDLDLLLFKIFQSVTFSLSAEYELKHRKRGTDCRRIMFQRQIELLAQLSPRWAEIEAKEHARILRENPFADGFV